MQTTKFKEDKKKKKHEITTITIPVFIQTHTEM